MSQSGARARDEAIVPTALTPEEFNPGNGPRFRHEHDISLDRPLLVHARRIAHE